MLNKYTIDILNQATSLDMVLRYYSNQQSVCFFGDKKLVLLDGELGRAGQYHGPLWGLIDEERFKLTVTRDLNDLLILKI